MQLIPIRRVGALAIPIAAVAALTATLAGGSTGARTAAVPAGVVISNVRDQVFTVSWTSPSPAVGSVRYGPAPNQLSGVARDTRGDAHMDDTHYVVVRDLDPETTYYFDVETGGSVDNNGGAHYQVRTGTILDVPPPSDQILGRVLLADGTTLAVGAIAYVTLRDKDGLPDAGAAALLSSLVGDQGSWSVNLGNARVATGDRAFAYSASGDEVQIAVHGAASGTGELVVDTTADKPAPDLRLTLAGLPEATATDAAGPSRTPSPAPTLGSLDVGRLGIPYAGK